MIIRDRSRQPGRVLRPYRAGGTQSDNGGVDPVFPECERGMSAAPQNAGQELAGAVERDLARLNAFLDRQRELMLAEARRRRARATRDQRRWAERPAVDAKEMERRLEEGLDALMDRMDEETAAATARLVAIFEATQTRAGAQGFSPPGGTPFQSTSSDPQLQQNRPFP